MTLLLCFLLSTVLIGMAFDRFGPWVYVLITAGAALTALLFQGFGRLWS